MPRLQNIVYYSQVVKDGFGEVAAITWRLGKKFPNSLWTRWKVAKIREPQSTCTTTKQAGW